MKTTKKFKTIWDQKITNYCVLKPIDENNVFYYCRIWEGDAISNPVNVFWYIICFNEFKRIVTIGQPIGYNDKEKKLWNKLEKEFEKNIK